MSTLQVKNVPEDLRARLKKRVAEENCTLSDFILRSLERELDRQEWLSRLRQRPSADLGVPAARLVAEERSARDDDVS